MAIFWGKIFCILIIFLNIYSYAEQKVQQGPLVSVFYAPIGSGNLFVPDNNDSYTTVGNPLKGFNNSNAFQFTAGYFYSFWQSSFTYQSTSIKNQLHGNDEISGDVSSFIFKTGYKFNTPGSVSYQWLYLLGHYAEIIVGDNNSEASGWGYGIGFYSQHSFSIGKGFEFLFDYDLNLGVYRWVDFTSNFNVTKQTRKSIAVQAALGAGIHYEPYNISFLLKTCTFAKYMGFDEQKIGAYGVTFGFEISYFLPNFKYNKE